MSHGRLILRKGSQPGTVIPIATLPFTIGRVETNLLPLLDDRVSRHHAKIDLDGDVLTLFDLDSKNGTFVDQKRVRTRPLRHGDRIEIGASVFEFEEAAPAASPNTQVTEEFPADLAPAEFEWVAFLRLLRAQIPAKALAIQVLQLLQARFRPDAAFIHWDGPSPIYLSRGARDSGPRADPFDLPSVPNATPQVQRATLADGTAGLAAPLFSAGKVRGWIFLRPGAGDPALTVRDKADLESVRLIAETALERAGFLERAAEQQSKIALVEKYVSRETLDEIFAKSTDIQADDLAAAEREVTILFADIQGFTPLSERLPPQELASLLNAYFQRMVDVIAAQGGEVNKFIGDAIMALFGAHRAEPDGAARAVTAALGMAHALTAFHREVAPEKRFNIRIGVNTGTVVVGNMGSSRKLEFTVLGDAVNVASRLESIAGPNEVFIGKRTAELLGGAFELQIIPNTKVKGKSKEMDVYRVLGPKI